jgi:phage-related protein
VISHFNQIRSGAVRLVHDVTSWFSRLPGMILRAVGNLGSLLLKGGENLIMGLVHGIESVAMAPIHAVESIVGGIRNLLPFSPAKAGPLSGSGSPDLAGRKIPLMMAGGIDAGRPAVAAAAARMAGAAVTHPGGGAGGGGGQAVTLTIRGEGDDLVKAIVKALRYEIRTGGAGNVQRHLGWGTA